MTLNGFLLHPAGRLSTFTEVPLENEKGKTLRPDGAILVERGTRSWSCLVEVKTGNAPVSVEQVSAYLDLARMYGFDTVLTISNQIAAGPEDVPVSVDGRKLRTVNLRHLSWWRILTEAVMQHQHHGIKDPDQAWILAELVAYLEHESSGAIGFEDMGKHWVSVRDAARNETIRAADPGVQEVVERWQQLIEYLCLGLSQDLGVQVVSTQSRVKDGERWKQGLLESLARDGKLSGSFKVPDAVGPIDIEADLRSRRTCTSVSVAAPKAGRPMTRINWILRQLKKAPAELTIEVHFARTKETTALSLGKALEQPKQLLSPTDPKREPRSFTVTLARDLGTKRGRGERSFVLETRRQVVGFYGDLVENLRAWQPSAPKLPDPSPEEVAGEPRDLRPSAPTPDGSSPRSNDATYMESVVPVEDEDIV